MSVRDWINRILDPANRAWVISVGIHGLLVVLLLFRVGFEVPKPAPAPKLAIQATVIDESKARLAREAAAEAEKKREADARKKREAEAQKKREADARKKREAEAQKKREADARKKREAEAQKKREADAQKKREADAQKKREAEAQKKREAEAQKKREAEAQKKREAEAQKKREAEAQKKREAEAQKKREADAKARREQDLRNAMAEEEALNAAAQSGELARYQDVIRQKVERNWIRPAGAKAGLECEVLVNQIPGGDVVGVRIGTCNGGPEVIRSIEAAVLKSSPLPLPKNPALFDRNLRFVFRPED